METDGELRRRAWELLADWGQVIDGELKTWDFETRMRKADELAKFFIDGTIPVAEETPAEAG